MYEFLTRLLRAMRTGMLPDGRPVRYDYPRLRLRLVRQALWMAMVWDVTSLRRFSHRQALQEAVRLWRWQYLDARSRRQARRILARTRRRYPWTVGAFATTNVHTDVPLGMSASAAGWNSPLGQLDAAISDQVFNVKRTYGGGTADDTTPINNAIAAASLAGGGWVLLSYMATCNGTVNENAAYVTVIGNGWGTGITYSGAGVAVDMTNSRAGMRDVKVLTTGVGAGVIGLRINAVAGNNINYWTLRNVDIQANAKVAGQVGFKLVNTPTSNIYWGNSDALTIENFGTGAQWVADTTLGINANTFNGLNIRNCTTLLDLGAGYGNHIYGFQGDNFTLGLTTSGIFNQIYGRFEGGGGSQAYTLLAASQGNTLVIYDNCPVTSTDVGSDNFVTSPGLGQPKAYERPIDYVASFYPPLATGSGTVPTGANNAQFVKLEGITKTFSMSKVRLEVVISSGNYCVALYELVGTNLTQRATTGSIAMPGAGATEPAFTLAYIVRPGKVYYLGIACDNVTATFRALTGVVSTMVDVTSANVAGQLVYATGAAGMMPLPATVAIGGLAVDSKIFALIGK
jgi:hypothetical protein